MHPSIIEQDDDMEPLQRRFFNSGAFSGCVYDFTEGDIVIGNAKNPALFGKDYTDKPLIYEQTSGFENVLRTFAARESARRRDEAQRAKNAVAAKKDAASRVFVLSTMAPQRLGEDCKAGAQVKQAVEKKNSKYFCYNPNSDCRKLVNNDPDEANSVWLRSWREMLRKAKDTGGFVIQLRFRGEDLSDMQFEAEDMAKDKGVQVKKRPVCPTCCSNAWGGVVCARRGGASGGEEAVRRGGGGEVEREKEEGERRGGQERRGVFIISKIYRRASIL